MQFDYHIEHALSDTHKVLVNFLVCPPQTYKISTESIKSGPVTGNRTLSHCVPTAVFEVERREFSSHRLESLASDHIEWCLTSDKHAYTGHPDTYRVTVYLLSTCGQGYFFVYIFAFSG